MNRHKPTNCHSCLGLSSQVRAQVETLVADKARLAQENARLIRENLGLQVRNFSVEDLRHRNLLRQQRHNGTVSHLGVVCELQELLQYTFNLQWQKEDAEKALCNFIEELEYVSDGEGNPDSSRKRDLYHSSFSISACEY